MRLSTIQTNLICTAFKQHFLPNDHLWLFGSRVKDNIRGGDIDLYIETQQNTETAIKNKLDFVNELWLKLGSQKIDVIINILSEPEIPIYRIAKNTGIQLI